MALLNTARLAELSDLGGPAFVREIWQVFLESSAQDLLLVQKSVILGDCALTSQIAHRLKSASGNVGAEKMQGCCYALELAAKAESPADETTLMDLCTEVVLAFQETAHTETARKAA